MNDQDKLTGQVSELYEPSPLSFHHWLTKLDPTAFLPSAAEITQVSRLLAQYGIKTKAVLRFGLGIRISGTITQVETAFHTVIGQAMGAPAGQAAPFVAAAPKQIIRDVLPFAGPANVTRRSSIRRGRPRTLRRRFRRRCSL